MTSQGIYYLIRALVALVAIPFHELSLIHISYAAHLPLDAAEPVQQGLVFLRGAVLVAAADVYKRQR